MLSQTSESQTYGENGNVSSKGRGSEENGKAFLLGEAPRGSKAFYVWMLIVYRENVHHSFVPWVFMALDGFPEETASTQIS